MSPVKIAVRVDSLIGPGTPLTGGAKPLARALDQATGIGATSIELCGRHVAPLTQLSETGLRSLRKMLDDRNLTVASVRYPTRRGYGDPADLQRRIESTKATMSVAYRIGAPLVVNQIGTVPPPPSGDGPSGDRPSDDASDQRFELLAAVMEDLGRHGDRVGVHFAAETGTEPGQHLAALLARSTEGFVAAALNPGQLIVNRFDVGDAITALGERIRIVAAVDGVLDLAAGRGLRVPVGQGTADFPELIGQLEDIPYRGVFVIGSTSPPAVALREVTAAAEYLRNL